MSKRVPLTLHVLNAQVQNVCSHVAFRLTSPVLQAHAIVKRQMCCCGDGVHDERDAHLATSAHSFRYCCITAAATNLVPPQYHTATKRKVATAVAWPSRALPLFLLCKQNSSTPPSRFLYLALPPVNHFVCTCRPSTLANPTGPTRFTLCSFWDACMLLASSLTPHNAQRTAARRCRRRGPAQASRSLQPRAPCWPSPPRTRACACAPRTHLRQPYVQPPTYACLD